MSQAIWQMWAGAIDDTTCEKIIKECEYYAPHDAVMGYDGDSKQSDHRQSEVRWISKHDTNSKFIHDLIWNYALDANRQAFDVDITGLWDIQYTKYYGHNKGHYGKHYDTFWANPSMHDRKLSVTIQLSDPSQYEGGDFMFHDVANGPDPVDLKKKGTVLIFLSPIEHSVTPVTKGVRQTLVAWVEGPKWR
tara:strand:+ start:1057 stop:1629 length:573 start_codon:yes stop_codon:yes gene_type:complete